MNKKSGSQCLVNGKTHYERNREKYLKKAKDKRADIREFIKSKKNKPCMDCSVHYPTHIMQFDHISGEKLFNIGEWSAVGKGKKQIENEIEKCDVVCANCHAERTYKRILYIE